MHLKQVKAESMENLKFVLLSGHISYLQITNGDLQIQNVGRTFLLLQLLLPHYRNSKKCGFCSSTLFLIPLNAESNPICHLLALLGAHPILHFSRVSVNLFI